MFNSTSNKKKFTAQVKSLEEKYKRNPNDPTIWEQLDQLVRQHCKDQKYDEKSRDEKDRNTVLLMEQVLDMDFTKKKVRLGKNQKYELTMILLGFIDEDIKKQELEAKSSPVTGYIFTRLGLEIYPERGLFFYLYPPVMPWEVEPIIFEPIQQFIPYPKKLFCHKQNINDQLIEYLVVDINSNPMLEVVELQKNEMGPTGVERLFSVVKDHPGIKYIELMDNPITDIGAKYMTSVLPDCKLEKLSLNSARIGPAGAVALAEALGKNWTITYFGMGYNQVGNEGAKAFAEHLLHRYIPLNLRLGGNKISSKEAGNALLSLVHKNCFIIGIDLDGNEPLDSTIIEKIQKQVKANSEIYRAVLTSSAIKSSSLIIKKIRKTDKNLANQLQTAVDAYFRCQEDVVQTPAHLQATCTDIIRDKISDNIMMFKEIIAKLIELDTKRKKLYATEAEFEREERLFRRMEWSGPDIEIYEPPADLQHVQQILPTDNKPVLVNFNGNHIICLPQSWTTCHIKVFGDIHGNMTAVTEIANFLEADPNNRAICLGDYIDRGDSLGVLEELAAIKVKDPGRLVLLRGDHEQAHLIPEDEEFVDALFGSFHSRLIKGVTEQEILVAEDDKRKCIIPLYGADTIRDRARLAEVSRIMFQSMPLGCFLPVTDGEVILLTHGALFPFNEATFSGIVKNPRSLFEALGDIRRLLNIYSQHANKKELIAKLNTAGCIHLVCGHSHLIGSYGQTGQFQIKSTEGFVITANSALFSSHTESPYARALIIKNGQVQDEFVEIPVFYEQAVKDTICCAELETAAKEPHTSRFNLMDLLTLTRPDQRQHIVIYAMIKAVQIRDINLAIDIGRVYLSVLGGDYLENINSLITALREEMPGNPAINRIGKELQQSILCDQPKIKAIKGVLENVVIRFPDLHYSEQPTEDLADRDSITRFQQEVEYFMYNVFLNLKQQVDPTSIKSSAQDSKDGINIGEMAHLIYEVLCGIKGSGELPRVNVKIIQDGYKFRLLYSVPIGDDGRLQVYVNIQGAALTIEDVNIDIKQSSITHPELMPKIILGMLQKITDEVNKELAYAGRRLTIADLKLQLTVFTQFNPSFINIIRCLLGPRVAINIKPIEFKDATHNSIKVEIPFDLTESNRTILYDIYLVNTPHRTLRIDTIALGFLDQDQNSIPRMIGAELYEIIANRSGGYSYLFKALPPPLRINLRKIEKELQRYLRSKIYQKDSRIATQIIFNNTDILEISDTSLRINRGGNMEADSAQVLEYLQKQFAERIPDLMLRNAVIFIILSIENGATVIFGKVVSDILQANGFNASFVIKQYQYFINTIKDGEITIRFKVTESQSLHALNQIQSKGHIEFCLTKDAKGTVNVTCTGLEFRTDPPTFLEYEIYRMSEIISDLLQTSIDELNAAITNIQNIKEITNINSCVKCYIKTDIIEEPIEFNSIVRSLNRFNYDACAQELQVKGILDPLEQAHFVVLLGDKKNAISYVYHSVMQKIIKELIGENYLYVDTGNTKVTYHLGGAIEIFCAFQLHKNGAEKAILSLYNVRVIRSSDGTLHLDKIELGVQSKRIAQRIGRRLEKLLECRSDDLHYVTIFDAPSSKPLENLQSPVSQSLQHVIDRSNTFPQQMPKSSLPFFAHHGHYETVSSAKIEIRSNLCP